VFSGYLAGDDYVGALAALDLKLFLVPGSDGSCRAVREALSMGVPVIAARRGMLPELVQHDETGLVIEDDPETLASAILSLLSAPERRRGMGAQARRVAEERFSFRRYAESIAEIYREALATDPTR